MPGGLVGTFSGGTWPEEQASAERALGRAVAVMPSAPGALRGHVRRKAKPYREHWYGGEGINSPSSFMWPQMTEILNEL